MSEEWTTIAYSDGSLEIVTNRPKILSYEALAAFREPHTLFGSRLHVVPGLDQIIMLPSLQSWHDPETRPRWPEAFVIAGFIA